MTELVSVVCQYCGKDYVASLEAELEGELAGWCGECPGESMWR